ncbi:hypothetical protein ALQ43_200054 [Pseudomonas savastanoi pv. glycinea]|nr:hypothetical protein ALQ43_200054 [Pseudomonas savastanoi pv. glycinea]
MALSRGLGVEFSILILHNHCFINWYALKCYLQDRRYQYWHEFVMRIALSRLLLEPDGIHKSGINH